jgi:hypothetical protein
MLARLVVLFVGLLALAAAQKSPLGQAPTDVERCVVCMREYHASVGIYTQAYTCIHVLCDAAACVSATPGAGRRVERGRVA